MQLRFVVAMGLACALGGCTDSDWDHAFSYAGFGKSKEAASDEAPPAAVTAAPAVANSSEAWCRQVAKASAEDAAEKGFDAATQRHRSEITFSQCMRV